MPCATRWGAAAYLRLDPGAGRDLFLSVLVGCPMGPGRRRNPNARYFGAWSRALSDRDWSEGCLGGAVGTSGAGRLAGGIGRIGAGGPVITSKSLRGMDLTSCWEAAPLQGDIR